MSTPATIPDLIVGCRALYAAFDRFDHAVCQRLGIARSDLRCLNLLEDGPLGLGEVGRRLGLSSGSVTALVDRLAAAGLARRVGDPADRRAARVEVTPAAYAALAESYRRLAEEVGERFADYRPGELTASVRCLGDVADACEAATKSTHPPANA
jgi:DNA-binding MarR family transcriptional regulator